MPVVEQFLAGAVEFDGLTVGTGLVKVSAIKARPERILLYSIFYASSGVGSTVETITVFLSHPDRPDEFIQLAEFTKKNTLSVFVFAGVFPLPKVDDNRNFDIRFVTDKKVGDGTAGFDFAYKAF